MQRGEGKDASGHAMYVAGFGDMSPVSFGNKLQRRNRSSTVAGVEVGVDEEEEDREVEEEEEEVEEVAKVEEDEAGVGVDVVAAGGVEEEGTGVEEAEVEDAGGVVN